MSSLSDAYQGASKELSERLKPIVIPIMTLICLGFVANSFWLNDRFTGYLFAATVLASMIVSRWKQRIWRELEVKYGLTDG